jgi:nicotinamidase-related amidase
MNMADNNYTKERTALLFVDPYNDFLSEGGKLWPYVQGVATVVGLLENLRSITAAIRKAGIQIFIVPHRRWQPGDFESWGHPNPDQIAGAQRQVFAKDSWGGEWHPDFAPKPGDIIIKSIGARTVLRTPISTCN